MKNAVSTENLQTRLRGTPLESASSIDPVTQNGFTYPDLFRVVVDGVGVFAVKLRHKSQAHVADALACLASVSDPESLLNRYLYVLESGDHSILVSQWIDGIQPHNGRRDTLPEFFEKLARFNAANQVSGPYTSMYADGRHSDSIATLVDSELDYHRRYLGDVSLGNEITEALQPLKRGLACVVHEDMNTGNMILAGDGRHVFIDLEWVHKGLNLHQFDHMNFFGFREPDWHNITDEAAECYRAYFSALPMSSQEANDQIRAYELLAVIRQNTYWRYFEKTDMYEQTPIRLERVMGQDRFV